MKNMKLKYSMEIYNGPQSKDSFILEFQMLNILQENIMMLSLLGSSQLVSMIFDIQVMLGSSEIKLKVSCSAQLKQF